MEFVEAPNKKRAHEDDMTGTRDKGRSILVTEQNMLGMNVVRGDKTCVKQFVRHDLSRGSPPLADGMPGI